MMKDYHWYDILQYTALLLMAAAAPVGWRVALWVALLLALVSAVKVVARRRLGNPALTPALRWVLLMPLVYWAVLAVSLLWSGDVAAGWAVLRLKAALLIFPLCLLLTDTRYLDAVRMRALGYALVASVVGVFLFFAVKAGLGLADGRSFAAVTGVTFDPRHHAYTAMYATVAMVFVYCALSAGWTAMRGWQRGLLLASLPLLICYVVLVNSRAGMLAMGVAGLACVAHLAVVRRSWRLGVGAAVVLVGAIVAATQLLPGHVDRLASTLENVEQDARTYINRSNWNAVCQRPWFGYGVGDYRSAQVAQYGADSFDAGTRAAYNAHNQYMESLLAAGLPGLLALLLYLLSPLALALKRRSAFRFPVAMLTVVIMLNFLFESMLERQMGLLFIGFWIVETVLIMSVEENKFVHMQKS